MQEVAENLYVGDDRACRTVSTDWAVVHACKHPCHQNEIGYQGSLPRTHPEYLVAPRVSDLFLNIVDMDQQLSHEYTEPIISSALDFIGEHIASREVLVHCNQAQSRSPAIALLYLSKRAGELSDSSYREAKQEFQPVYPGYRPGRGVEAYLQNYWHQLE